jgi:hypothetical protein
MPPAPSVLRLLTWAWPSLSSPGQTCCYSASGSSGVAVWVVLVLVPGALDDRMQISEAWLPARLGSYAVRAGNCRDLITWSTWTLVDGERLTGYFLRRLDYLLDVIAGTGADIFRWPL